MPFPIADGRIKTLGEDQELRTSILIRDNPIRGEGHVDFLGESEGSLPPPHDSFPDAGEAINDFLVHVRKLQIPPSRWTKSQTLLAERRIIPYSTELHWRLQNYSYKLGCYARTPHRRLLEYRWVKRFVWSMDRLHSIYSIGRKTSWRIHVVRGEINKKTAYIQARSFMGQSSGSQWESTPSWRKSKNGLKKRFILKTHENCGESISSTLRIRNSRKPWRTHVRSWKRQLLLLCPVKLWRIVGSGGSDKNKTKLACILEANESNRMRVGNSEPSNHEDHIAGKGDNSLQHYNLVHKFIPMPQAMKIPAGKAAVDKDWKNWRKYRHGSWRKSEVNQRWSMKQGMKERPYNLRH